MNQMAAGQHREIPPRQIEAQSIETIQQRFVVVESDEISLGKSCKRAWVTDPIEIRGRCIELCKIVFYFLRDQVRVCRAAVADRDVRLAATKVGLSEN